MYGIPNTDDMLTLTMRWSPAWTAIVAAVLSASAAAQQRGGAGDLTDLLARIGARVEQVLHPRPNDRLHRDGRASTAGIRSYVHRPCPYARLRVARRMGAAHRGRPVPRRQRRQRRPPAPLDRRPTATPAGQACLHGPGAVSPEPLGMLLPGRSAEIRVCLGRDGRDQRSSQRETRLPADGHRPAGDRMARGLRQCRVARPSPRAGLD